MSTLRDPAKTGRKRDGVCSYDSTPTINIRYASTKALDAPEGTFALGFHLPNFR